MGASPALSDQFVLEKCLGESTLRNCTGWKRDNVVVIELDTDDFGEVIILDVPESFQNKFRKRRRRVISLDDDDDVDESRDGVCHTDSNVNTSSRCSPTQGNRPCTSAYVDEDVNEGNTPVKLSKSKRTYSGKNISRNRYGLSPDFESCSSDSDCSDCELIEGSLGKLREQWEKASFRKRHDASCVPPDFGNRAGTSRPSHSIYDNAEEGTPEDAEPLGEQSSLRKCSHYDEGDNAVAGSPQTVSQESSDHDHDPMEVDEQSSRTCDNFISSDLNDKAKGGSLAPECPLDHNAEQVLEKISEPVGDYNDFARNIAEQSKFPWQKCDGETQNEVFSRIYPADASKGPSQDVESDHAASFDRQQGVGIPSMPSDLKSSCSHVNESLFFSVENNVITDRQKIKETEEYKHAMEEELAARQQQLLLQADEAQRLRNRKKAEKMRLMMNERRQKERVEEIRQTRRKDEENMNLKEKHRAEVKKELRMIESTCFNMASLLRSLGIHVGGGLYPSPNEVQVAYKRACLKFHPDRMSATDLRQQVEAEEKFKLISNMKDKFLLK